MNGRPICPGTSIPAFIPLDDKPFESNLKVAYSQSLSLTPYTDPYYRGFDNQYPDYFRYWEWARDFDATYGSGTTDLPALSLVRLMHDHTGNFATATHGVNTPELQQADNDYAVGLLVQKIANSIYANNTLIFVIEDDSQDGGDHVDSHRSIALIAGSYVKQGLVKTRYNTINFVRTIEEVLNLPPLNMNDALASPMADIFSSSPHPWTFTATASASLYASSVTGIPLPVRPAGMIVPKSKHDAEYWARVTKGMDFTSEDRFNFATYNRVLWKGLMGRRPYPAVRNGKDLRHNRQKLLACYRVAVRQTARLDSLANQ